MPDQLCLSLWLRDFDEATLLGRFRELLRLFPFSGLRPGIVALRIYALEFTEPGLSEVMFAGDVDADTVVDLAEEFPEPDCAYLVEGWWDLWRHDANGTWQLSPSPVVLTCFGPQFENDMGDHIRLELGAEERFLPLAGVPHSARKAHSNLQSIARLAREIEKGLPLGRQSLWSESGEDFAERLMELADEAD
jgi:hypothetical protein